MGLGAHAHSSSTVFKGCTSAKHEGEMEGAEGVGRTVVGGARCWSEADADEKRTRRRWSGRKTLSSLWLLVLSPFLPSRAPAFCSSSLVDFFPKNNSPSAGGQLAYQWSLVWKVSLS